MVIGDLDIVSVAVLPDETQAPLTRYRSHSRSSRVLRLAYVARLQKVIELDARAEAEQPAQLRLCPIQPARAWPQRAIRAGCIIPGIRTPRRAPAPSRLQARQRRSPRPRSSARRSSDAPRRTCGPMAAPGRCEEAVLGDVRALAEAVRGVCRIGQPPLAAGPPVSSTTNAFFGAGCCICNDFTANFSRSG